MSDDIQKNQEMDNDNSKSSSEKVLDKWVFWGAVLILLIILFVLIKIGFTPANNLPAKNIAPTQKSVDLCAKFPKVQGEISCEEAVKIALAKYPGDAKYIKNETVSFAIGVLPDITKVEKNVWTIGINLKEPGKMGNAELNSAKLYVVKENGEFRMNSLRSGKL